MWRFVIFLTISLASSDKLNRKYLPPPGKFPKGNLDDLDVPLAFPKENYASTKYPHPPFQETPFGQTHAQNFPQESSTDKKNTDNNNQQKLDIFITKDGTLPSKEKSSRPEEERSSRPLNFLSTESDKNYYVPILKTPSPSTPFSLKTTTYSPIEIERFDTTINPITSTVTSSSYISHNLQNIPDNFIPSSKDDHTVQKQNNAAEFTSQPNQNQSNTLVKTYLPVNQSKYLPTTSARPAYTISSITNPEQSEFVNKEFRQYSGAQPPSPSDNNSSQQNIPIPNKIPLSESNQYINNFGGDPISETNNIAFRNPMRQDFFPPQSINLFPTSTPSSQEFNKYSFYPGKNPQSNSQSTPIYSKDRVQILPSTQKYLESSTVTIKPESNVFQTNLPQDFSSISVSNLNIHSPKHLDKTVSDYPSTTLSYYNPEETYSTISPKFNYNSKSIEGTPRFERPQAKSDREAETLHYEKQITPEGYYYSYDTTNGIHVDESAATVNGTQASGSYSYIGDDGKLYKVVYTADENGFVPHGNHLPTPPPIPEAIQRVIEQAQRDRDAGIVHDGFYDEQRYGFKNYAHPSDTKKIPNHYDNVYTNFKNIDQELEISEPFNEMPSKKNYPNHNEKNVKSPNNEKEQYKSHHEILDKPIEHPNTDVTDNRPSSPVYPTVYPYKNDNLFTNKTITFTPKMKSSEFSSYGDSSESPNTTQYDGMRNRVELKGFDQHNVPGTSTVRVYQSETSREEDGYEYFPPQTRFDNINQFPIRNEESSQTSTNEKPGVTDDDSSSYYTATDAPKKLEARIGNPVFRYRTPAVSYKTAKTDSPDFIGNYRVQIPNKIESNTANDKNDTPEFNYAKTTASEENDKKITAERPEEEIIESENTQKPSHDKLNSENATPEFHLNVSKGNEPTIEYSNSKVPFNEERLSSGPDGTSFKEFYDRIKNIKEDFPGPKQPQRFDSSSGYYY